MLWQGWSLVRLITGCTSGLYSASVVPLQRQTTSKTPPTEVSTWHIPEQAEYLPSGGILMYAQVKMGCRQVDGYFLSNLKMLQRGKVACWLMLSLVQPCPSGLVAVGKAARHRPMLEAKLTRQKLS